MVIESECGSWFGVGSHEFGGQLFSSGGSVGNFSEAQGIFVYLNLCFVELRIILVQLCSHHWWQRQELPSLCGVVEAVLLHGGTWRRVATAALFKIDSETSSALTPQIVPLLHCSVMEQLSLGAVKGMVVTAAECKVN